MTPTQVPVNSRARYPSGRMVNVVEFGEATSPGPGLWPALRRDPKHAPEIAVLYALPQLAPHVQKWWLEKSTKHPSAPPARMAKRVVRRSTGVARRGGLITGSSFYVGMAPAMAMIYCEQLVLALRIAAVYGRDPMDPIRAADILVIQGRYESVSNAAAALRQAGIPHPETTRSERRAFFDVVSQLPSMIGLRIRRFSARSPLEIVIVGAEVASYLVPVISLPVWAFASARAMRRLGRAASDFYSRPETDLRLDSPILLPPRPTARTRRIVIASVVPLALALGVLFSLLPVGALHPGLRWLGLVIGELALLLTFARLIRLTRISAD
jgi:hypothetical protein